MYHCEKCNRDFEKRKAYIGHCRSHNIKNKEKIKQEHICKFCKKSYESGMRLGGHIISCKLNPNSQNTRNKMALSRVGKNLSESHKKNVSISMKKAHKEKRAWNIGKSRWNSKMSYPEKFFTKVIEKEFQDKNYQHEFPMGIYSLDFAWPHKMRAIEIDGEQHQRFKEYKERDKRKDKFAKNNGWDILRISWKDMYEDTKEKIKEAFNFIHDI